MIFFVTFILGGRCVYSRLTLFVVVLHFVGPFWYGTHFHKNILLTQIHKKKYHLL